MGRSLPAAALDISRRAQAQESLPHWHPHQDRPPRRLLTGPRRCSTCPTSAARHPGCTCHAMLDHMVMACAARDSNGSAHGVVDGICVCTGMSIMMIQHVVKPGFAAVKSFSNSGFFILSGLT